MFWIHIVLLAIGVLGLLLVIFGSEGIPNLWALVPGIAIMVMVAILLPNSCKKCKQADKSEVPYDPQGRGSGQMLSCSLGAGR